MKWNSEPHDDGGDYQWAEPAGHPDVHLWVSPQRHEPFYNDGKPVAYFTVAVDSMVVVEGRTPTVAASKFAAEQAAARVIAGDYHEAAAAAAGDTFE